MSKINAITESYYEIQLQKSAVKKSTEKLNGALLDLNKNLQD